MRNYLASRCLQHRFRSCREKSCSADRQFAPACDTSGHDRARCGGRRIWLSQASFLSHGGIRSLALTSAAGNGRATIMTVALVTPPRLCSRLGGRIIAAARRGNAVYWITAASDASRHKSLISAVRYIFTSLEAITSLDTRYHQSRIKQANIRRQQSNRRNLNSLHSYPNMILVSSGNLHGLRTLAIFTV